MFWKKHKECDKKHEDINIPFHYAIEIANRITGCKCVEMYFLKRPDLFMKQSTLDYAMYMPNHECEFKIVYKKDENVL